MKFIWCLLFGHRQLKLRALKGDSFAEIKDYFGDDLVKINLCERCGLVFWKFDIYKEKDKRS